MNLVEQLKQCRTVQEALLMLAAAIDELVVEPPNDFDQPLVWDRPDREDPTTWPKDFRGQTIPPPQHDNRAVVEGDDVIVQPVSEERRVQREEFAVAQRLHEFYGPGLSESDFLDAYVKGGPRWLYYTNRDCVMSMPVQLRQALVADVLLDSPSEADEIGRDILKFSFDEGARETAQLEYHREARDHGAPYRGHD